ncbi:MAG: prepilin-type N-terminal cleavage/methylation domain-containing protein [Planctomycetes bacterium]|nr:prepilin-type N-terminal cleavage/methylation domain-containing protein [Planctomycetota bacterium]
MNKRRGQAAFTMIEMLVAMAVATIMILFVNQIFNTARSAVSSGLGVSKIIQHARIANDQIDRDAEEMVGPTAGGMLIIGNKTITGVKLKSSDIQTPPTRNIDQLMFIRYKNDIEPVCPSNDNSVANTSGAPFVKIWYGQCQRTTAAGTDDGALGAAGTSNQYALNWILGRQAMFLEGGSVSGNSCTDATETSNVGGAAAGFYTGGVTKQAYTALADVCKWSLGDINKNATSDTVALTYTYGTQRLRVNATSPGGAPSGSQLAQMHPLFVPNVSELQIEFAGDYATGTTNSAPPDGAVDTDASGNIKWYGISLSPPGVTALTATNIAKGWVFRKTNAAMWPYMIRIRYRMHDDKGVVPGSDNQPGRWFEQVIRVNRS